MTGLNILITSKLSRLFFRRLKLTTLLTCNQRIFQLSNQLSGWIRLTTQLKVLSTILTCHNQLTEVFSLITSIITTLLTFSSHQELQDDQKLQLFLTTIFSITVIRLDKNAGIVKLITLHFLYLFIIVLEIFLEHWELLQGEVAFLSLLKDLTQRKL